jgi:hypothetical protein
VKTSKTKHTLSRHDYGPALQGALAWLGDRYLLAEPLNRRSDDQKVQVSEPQGSQSRSPGVEVMA